MFICLSSWTSGVLLLCPIYQMSFDSGVGWRRDTEPLQARRLSQWRCHFCNNTYLEIIPCQPVSIYCNCWISHSSDHGIKASPLTNDCGSSKHFSISSLCLVCQVPLVNYHPIFLWINIRDTSVPGTQHRLMFSSRS